MRLSEVHEREFSVFVDASGQALLRRAWLLAGGQQAGEDLLQQVLVKAARHWPRIRSGSPLAYCMTALTTTAVDVSRRARWREVLTGAVPERAVADQTVAVDGRDSVLRLLALLPARQRAVVVLRFYADLSEAQVAAELGITVGTVKSTASRGLATLRAAAENGQVVAMREGLA